MHRGILCKDTHGTVVRFAPPLVVQREALEHAMGVIAEVMP
jgi:ornithine--oxo-acid transaminase